MITPNPDASVAVPAEPASQALGHIERLLALLLLTAGLVMRAWFLQRMKVDSDEPQHLHVVWGWTAGMVQYRDFFDNHTPLFHLLFAPVLRGLGERADILVAMRWAVQPLYLMTLGFIAWLSRSLFGPRAGLWAVPLCALLPIFFIESAQFRADDLWMALWMLALTVLLSGSDQIPGLDRMMCFGLVLGATVATSLKTSMLMAMLIIAGTMTAVILRTSNDPRPFLRRWVGRLAMACLGLIVVPGVLAIAFRSMGAWTEMVNAVFFHNTGVGVQSWPKYLAGLGAAAVLLILVGAVGRRWARQPAINQRQPRVVFLTLLAILIYPLLKGLWPLVTAQDILVIVPVIAVGLAPLLLHLGSRLFDRPAAVVASVCGIELIILGARLPRQDYTAEQRELIGATLKLTTPTDAVIDTKGETIYRHRAFRPVLEHMTLRRLSNGTMPDILVDELIASRACVAVNSSKRIPASTEAFLARHFVSVGPVRVAGQALGNLSSGAAASFEIAIPARYAIVTAPAPPHGVLDATPYTGPRFLDAGRHEFIAVGTGEQDVFVIWARAVERGFYPTSGKGNP